MKSTENSDQCSNSASDWMKEALSVASQATIDVPVGCVIVRDGKLIAAAHNRREMDKDPVGHAEILAIRQAARALDSWRLDGCALFTTLEPCPMCAEAIIQTRITALYYGAYDLKSGACGSAFNLFKKGRIYPVPDVIGGIEEEECQRILTRYFEANVRSNSNNPNSNQNRHPLPPDES